ncbi:Uncharacterized protein dnm_079790 [Desulfonema magnum]|uniref:Uncharacterized protein n=1 Tax=Desulfonema magnum TaxID=45655 RepID=A0A975BUB9_9BACT|nr:Uncharacterized protein dnm_079790 [Desulfonema magnum]
MRQSLGVCVPRQEPGNEKESASTVSDSFCDVALHIHFG